MIRWLKIFFLQARPLNLFIAFLSFSYASYFSTGRSLDFLNDSLFRKEVFVLITLMATGYWTNDAFDIKTDLLKNPRKNLLRTRKEALLVILFSQIFALGSILCSWFWSFPTSIKILNTSAFVLLFVYSSFLKRKSPLGNVVIALLTALTLFIPNELYNYRFENVWLIIFAFWITLIREITKDLEDLDADLQAGRKTLPILFGKTRTCSTLLFLYVIFYFLVFSPVLHYYLFEGIFLGKYLLVILFLVLMPLSYNLFSLWKRKENYSVQSAILKAVIFGGFAALYFV